jgi:hypothetical protein
MFNIRIIIASIVTFILLLGVMSYVTDKGYEKIKPKLEEQKEKALNQKKELSDMIRSQMEDLGVSITDMDENAGDDFPDLHTGATPLRPIGTWMGIRKDESSRIALIKFDKSKYWLVIKDPERGDLTEKGEYEYYFDQIKFKPAARRNYSLDYEMISRKGFRLHGRNYFYTFEKTDKVKVDF